MDKINKKTLFLIFFISLYIYGCISIPIPKPGGNLELWLNGTVPKNGEKKANINKVKNNLSELKIKEIRKRAEELFKTKNIKNVPKDFVPLWKARRYILAGEFDKGALEIVDWLSIHRNDFIGLVELGRARIGQGELDEAIKILKKALSIAPSDDEARFYLAKAYTLKGDKTSLHKAYSILSKFEKEKLMEKEKALIYGNLLLRLNEYKKAEDFLTQVCKRKPQEQFFFYYLAQAKRFLGKIDKAIDILDKILSKNKKVIPEILWLHGVLMRRKSRFDIAYEDFKKLKNEKGKDYKVFFAVSLNKDILLMLLNATKKEKELGKRIFYLPGEIYEILKTEKNNNERLLAIRALRKNLPQDYIRILNIALRDKDSKIRTEAINIIGFLSVKDLKARKLLYDTLTHKDPKVRGFAAQFVGKLKDKNTPIILLKCLEKERNAYAFRCIHDALEEATGRRVLLFSGEEEDKNSRARVIKQWKEIIEK